MRAVRVGCLVTLLSALASALAWARPPADVPTLPGVRGPSSALGVALASPLVLAGVTLLLGLLGRRRPGWMAWGGAGETALAWGLALFAALHVLQLGAAVGAWRADGRAGAMLLGAVALGLGNVFGKVRRNWLVGVRTPWTLTDERVWRRTHRTAAWMLCVGGAVGVLLAPALPGPTAWRVAVALLVAPMGAAVVLSWVYWREVRRQDGRTASARPPHPVPLPGGEGR